MNESTRPRLEARKRDVYGAIHTLDRDHAEGTIDLDAYRRARARFELEAAGILAQLDRLDDSTPQEAGQTRRRTWLIVGATGIVVLAVALLLGGALRARTGNAAITGDVGQSTPAAASNSSPQVLAAQNQVGIHPHDPLAALQLAIAYVDAGNNRAAEIAYRRAIQLAPRRPEARTQYAMFKGSAGNTRTALTQLSVVERDDPSYARAWLIDGLLSSRVPGGLPRAIRAWQRFLVLSPRSSVAPQVRALLAGAERARKAQP